MTTFSLHEDKNEAAVVTENIQLGWGLRRKTWKPTLPTSLSTTQHRFMTLAADWCHFNLVCIISSTFHIA